MGDDVHVRTQAATNLFLRHLLPALMGTGHPRAGDVGRYLSANHLLFLTLAMASARTLTAWAAQVAGSSVITTMARNGTQYGVKLSGSRAVVLAPPRWSGARSTTQGEVQLTELRTSVTALCSSSSDSAVPPPQGRRPWASSSVAWTKRPR